MGPLTPSLSLSLSLHVSYPTLYKQLFICQIVLGVLQDSFYHNLSEDELERVHEYNFDHPGEAFLCLNMDCIAAAEIFGFSMFSLFYVVSFVIVLVS